MIDKALKLACKELSKEFKPFKQFKCPYSEYKECVSDIHPVICDDIKENCWYLYFINKVKTDSD